MALGISGLFASLLVIVDIFDRGGHGFGIAVVLAACVVAAWAPSRRAARVDPVRALEAD